MDHARERLVWRIASGRILRESDRADDFSSPISRPTAHRLAVARRDLGNTDVWRVKMSDGSMSRLTFDPRSKTTRCGHRAGPT